MRGLVSNLDWHMYTLGHRLRSKVNSSSHSIHENTEHKMYMLEVVVFGLAPNSAHSCKLKSFHMEPHVMNL